MPRISMKKVMIFAFAAMLFAGCSQTNPNMKEQNVLDAIKTRVSVRQFTGEKISDDQIRTLLECAMAAPSAMNKQPWAFVVVTDEEPLARLAQASPYSRCDNHPACAFVLCGDLTNALEGEAQNFWVKDVSAATENLLLAAHAMGLGAVWTGVHPSSERVAAVREALSLPEHIVPMCIVPVGVPAEQPAVKNKFKEDNIHFNKW